MTPADFKASIQGAIQARRGSATLYRTAMALSRDTGLHYCTARKLLRVELTTNLDNYLKFLTWLGVRLDLVGVPVEIPPAVKRSAEERWQARREINRRAVARCRAKKRGKVADVPPARTRAKMTDEERMAARRATNRRQREREKAKRIADRALETNLPPARPPEPPNPAKTPPPRRVAASRRDPWGRPAKLTHEDWHAARQDGTLLQRILR